MRKAVAKRFVPGFLQIATAVCTLLLVQIQVQNKVESTRFAHGFLPIWPGGESIAYDEFDHLTGKKVVFLGNSVMLQADFPGMSRVVKRHYGQNVELFNFGRPAAAAADYRVMLARLKGAKPALVVVQLHDVSVRDGYFNGLQLPQVFHTNVKGEITNSSVVEKLGLPLFYAIYGAEGFFQSLLQRIPLYLYRDGFRQSSWIDSQGFFKSLFWDARSRFWRHVFQGLGTDHRVASEAREFVKEKTTGGYPGPQFSEIQKEQFEKFLTDLQESGIPFLVYLQPVPPQFVAGEVPDYLRETLRKHQTPFIDMRSQLGAEQFTDPVHMQDSRHLFDLMFASERVSGIPWKEISWLQAGFSTNVIGRFDIRRLELFAGVSLNGQLRRRDYFLFVNDSMAVVRKGNPFFLDSGTASEMTKGLPIVLDDLRRTYWGRPDVLSHTIAVRLVRGSPVPQDERVLTRLRFYLLEIPPNRRHDLYQVRIDGRIVHELGSIEADMNVGYWDTEEDRTILILPEQEHFSEVSVSLISQERELGSLLSGLSTVTSQR